MIEKNLEKVRKMSTFSRFLLFLLVFLVASKALLLGNGYLANPDENRYITTQQAAEYALKGDWYQLIRELYTLDARPGLVIVTMPVAMLQIAVANLLLVPYNSFWPSLILQTFNLVIYVLLLIVLIRISCRFGFSIEVGLTGAVLYGLLQNSYVYIRHAFPYDIALLLMLLGLLWLTGQPSRLRSFGIGAVVSFGLTVYPGYFPLAFAIGLFALYHWILYSGLKAAFSQAGLAIVGAMSIPWCFEAASRLVGVSYFREIFSVSGAIIQGDFSESFTFLFKYLIEVEKIYGISFLLLFIIAIYVVIKNPDGMLNEFKISRFAFFLVCLVFFYIIYAYLGYFAQKMVFYGRLLHQYFPFMALFAALGFNYLIRKDNRVGFIVISVFLIISVMGQYSYAKTAYPKDIFRRVVLNNPTFRNYNIVEYCPWDSASPVTKGMNLKYDTINSSKVVVTDFCYVYYLKNKNMHHYFSDSQGLKLVFQAPHFMNLPVYQFEGAGITERRLYRLFPMSMRIYRTRK